MQMAPRPWFDSWVRKICWRKNRLPTPLFLSFPCGSAGKESTCNVGNLGSIPGLGRSPGEGKRYPLQYSGLENSMDCIVHRVAKSRTRLSDFHFTSLHFICLYVYVYGYNIMNGLINFLVLHFHSSSQLIPFHCQPNIQLGSENSMPSTKMTKYQSKILVI